MFSKKTLTSCITICLFSSVISHAYRYDPNDFATEVIDYNQEYIPGVVCNEPNNALGRPTIDTIGDYFSYPDGGKPLPVVPVYPAYRFSELVNIGIGGHLTLKFNHLVLNNASNPYGIDFIIFGNSFYMDGVFNSYYDPRAHIVDQWGLNTDPGIVSVSQDGQTWYTFTDGPFADDFAPTLGRVNLWGNPTNPTLPLNPLFTLQSFDGLTVAQVCADYGNSAGGTSFDIGQLGLDWIQYVRIENNGMCNSTEIDAVSIVKSLPSMGDLNEDGKVNSLDFAIMAQGWQVESDWEDLATLCENWLECAFNCD